ncbi:hypothetical protein [Pseudonocardia sp. DLS-67]
MPFVPVVLGGAAVVAVLTSLAAALFGVAPASSLLVVAAGGLAGFVAGRATAVAVPAPGVGERLRARAAERDRTIDDGYSEGEIRWRWRKAAEGAGLSRLVWTPTGPTDSVPLVLNVRLHPFPVLTVRLRPGQLVRDVVAVQERLRELMAARMIRITPVALDVVTIELW